MFNLLQIKNIYLATMVFEIIVVYACTWEHACDYVRTRVWNACVNVHIQIRENIVEIRLVPTCFVLPSMEVVFSN